MIRISDDVTLCLSHKLVNQLITLLNINLQQPFTNDSLNQTYCLSMQLGHRVTYKYIHLCLIHTRFATITIRWATMF